MVDAHDLGSCVRVRVRVPYPLPDQTRVTYGSPGIFKWLRSIEVVHFLGKEEVTGSNPVGASSVERFNIALDVLLVAQAGVRKLPICLLSSTG